MLHLYNILNLFTGADITDYFNYGFTEDTWKAYQQRQHVLRSQGQAYHSNNTYGGGGGSGHHYHHHNNAQHQINVRVVEWDFLPLILCLSFNPQM